MPAMAGTEQNSPSAPAGSSDDDCLRQLARLLGRVAARRALAQTDERAPAIPRQHEERLDERAQAHQTDQPDDHC